MQSPLRRYKFLKLSNSGNYKTVTKLQIHQPESVLSIPQSCTSRLNYTVCTTTLAYLPSLRHCLISPPEDMFFSASISLKLRELANTRTSTIAMRRLRNVTAVSADMPCVTSMFSNSVFKRGELTLFKIGKCGTCYIHYR